MFSFLGGGPLNYDPPSFLKELSTKEKQKGEVLQIVYDSQADRFLGILRKMAESNS